jgi:hypothetical protein
MALFLLPFTAMVRFVSGRFQQPSTKEKRARRAAEANDDKTDKVVEMAGYAKNPMASHTSAGKRKASSRVLALADHDDAEEQVHGQPAVLPKQIVNIDTGTGNDQNDQRSRKLEKKIESMDQQIVELKSMIKLILDRTMKTDEFKM